MAFTFYGKKSCITCQKAKAYLEGQSVDFQEIPIETQPPTRAVLERLIDPANVKASLNARSTIYKENNLGKQVPDVKTAITLMLQDPNLIKRPVILKDNGALYQGFDEATLGEFIQN
jgi:Spx/MgsR family transcriptional regulator